jgi:hypothetical protein
MISLAQPGTTQREVVGAPNRPEVEIERGKEPVVEAELAYAKGSPLLQNPIHLRLPPPAFLDKERHRLLGNEETILRVCKRIVVLGLDQHIIILAQIDDPPITFPYHLKEQESRPARSAPLNRFTSKDLLLF